MLSASYSETYVRRVATVSASVTMPSGISRCLAPGGVSSAFVFVSDVGTAHATVATSAASAITAIAHAFALDAYVCGLMPYVRHHVGEHIPFNMV